jgi:lipid-A-disaccharide synthase
MFVAGDPSGDLHASHVIRRLRDTAPEFECCGVGGAAMEREGLTQLLPFGPFNCMGFLEVLKSLPFLTRARRHLLREIATRRPAALVLVDYASFNIPLMKAAHEMGVPVVWYIAPKVWAWREKRAEVIGNCATVIATIFPFEPKHFERYPARAVFVGNPLVEALGGDGGEQHAPLSIPKPGTFFRMTIVPGSRRQEVKHMLRPMLQAYMVLKQNHRQFRATVSKCPWLPARLYDEYLDVSGVDLCEGTLDDAMRGSDVALVTSGTATLETALRGTPHVIAYRTSAISYRLYRAFLKIPHIGLPNIIAGEKLVPECIQGDANPVSMAAELEKFISSYEYYQHTVQRLLYLRDLLGSKKPSEEVARIIQDVAG